MLKLLSGWVVGVVTGLLVGLLSLTLQAVDSSYNAQADNATKAKMETPTGQAVNNAGSDKMAVVIFDSGSAVIADSYRQDLNRIADRLKNDTNAKASVTGYADNVGKTHTNNMLADKRAKVVKEYLTTAGVDASRITAAGYGEVPSKASNNTLSAKQMNRRVVVTVN